MTHEEEKEYQEKMGGPEMEYLQYQSEHPDMNTQEGKGRLSTIITPSDITGVKKKK